MSENRPENRMDEYPRRRRRRKRVPKWKRMLRKYWPPIRFGLICLALVLVVVLAVSGIVKGIRNAANNRPDETITDTTPPTTTESPEQIEARAKAILAKADEMAAGFDYLGAIELIEAFEHYQEYEFLTSRIPELEELDKKLVSWPRMDQITHVFFHSLIVDTDRCFDGDEDEDGYNQYMTTTTEFWAMLEAMYEKGYILVSPYDVAYEVTSTAGSYFTYGNIRIPEGRIPFLMSQDDVNYYSYMIGTGDGKGETPIFADSTGDGFASRIVIGEDGYPTCEYMDANGNVTTGDYDLVPLLEKFIQQHPDFSYHGARAMLGMTGYEGVFGYRTKPSYENTMGTEAYQREVEAAREVAQCLRDHGWVLASHSYGHPAYGQIPAENVAIDSDKWEDTVQTIIGDTDVILYPHGSDIAGTGQYTFDNAKFAALYEDGYRYFFNVDSHVYWAQLGANYYRAGRRNLDGYRMYYNPNKLADLFDVDAVWDPARPSPVPPI